MICKIIDNANPIINVATGVASGTGTSLPFNSVFFLSM